MFKTAFFNVQSTWVLCLLKSMYKICTHQTAFSSEKRKAHSAFNKPRPLK